MMIGSTGIASLLFVVALAVRPFLFYYSHFRISDSHRLGGSGVVINCIFLTLKFVNRTLRPNSWSVKACVECTFGTHGCEGNSARLSTHSSVTP